MNIIAIKYDSLSYFWHDQLIRIGINMWHPNCKQTSHSIDWDWDDDNFVIGSLRKVIPLE